MLEFKDVKFSGSLDNKKYNISDEIYRIYYNEGKLYFRIDSPIALGIAETGNHRVVDKEGVCYRIPMLSTTVIEWKNKGDLQANF